MRREDFTLPGPPSNDRPGDRWACGSGDASPCSRGPDRHGICPLAEACQPRRTWQGRRRQISVIAGAVLVVLSVATIATQRQAELFKPGDLSTPHAQILDGTLTSQRCEACHPKAGISLMSNTEPSHEVFRITQSDRCMECHRRTMDASTAKLAHNLPRQTRDAIRRASLREKSDTSGWNDWLPGPAVDQENVACSVCHREHHGADGNLLDVSDAQCQTCHSQRFGSFATSHPDWGHWPYGRGGEIAFDHASHANKHYPATMSGGAPVAFQCTTCHPRGRDGELRRSVGYEQSCASCHDKPLQLETANGVDLVVLPSVGGESAGRLKSWPNSAIGFYDGKVSPLTDLLIRGDTSAADALRRLPNQDFGSVRGDVSDRVAAAETVAAAHRELLSEIQRNGQQALLDRTLRLGIKRDTVQSLIRTISPQLIAEAHRRWFEIAAEPEQNVESDLVPDSSLGGGFTTGDRLDGDQTGDDLSGGDLLGNDLLEDDLLGDDLLGADSLAGDPLAVDPLSSAEPLNAEPLSTEPEGLNGEPEADPPSLQFDPERWLPAGGWYIDDVQTAIRYRGSGHDDPVLKAVIEMMSQVPVTDRARTRLLETRAVRACIQCHAGALDSRPTWVSRPRVGNLSELTKFSHRSHLNVAQLADCKHCHEIAPESPTNVRLVHQGAKRSEFLTMSKQACVACHVREAAGDRCTTCHRYHAHGASLNLTRRTDPFALER